MTKLIAAVAVVGAVILGCGVLRQPRETSQERVVARELVIVDKSQVPRLRATANDGTVSLQFLDANGKLRLSASVGADSVAKLALHSPGGQERIAIIDPNSVAPAIRILDANGTIRSELTLTDDGGPLLILSDRVRRRVELGCTSNPERDPTPASLAEHSYMILYDSSANEIFRVPEKR